MTLAIVLSFSMLFCRVAAAMPVPGPPQSAEAPAAQPVAPAGTQDSSTTQANPPAAQPQQTAPDAAAQTPPAAPAQTPAQKVPVKKRNPQRRRKAASSNCLPAASAAPAGSDSAKSASADPASANAPSPSSAPGNCPPTKRVVRQGGTSEPAIELAGGAGGEQATHQRNSTDQMLASTNDNLKKLEGRKLTASQQDMVSQIHQYMKESKAAVAAGDVERGHNLAVKAHLLSDELMKQ
jgi:hypothetical protein